jgi:hypothetical protein
MIPTIHTIEAMTKEILIIHIVAQVVFYLRWKLRKERDQFIQIRFCLWSANNQRSTVCQAHGFCGKFHIGLLNIGIGVNFSILPKI